jgi:predicted glycoside hydrolase/deacetylase ChbG (UPF0249 family)
MAAGICDGVDELAAERRLSATSAIVTLPSWHRYGPRLANLRSRIAIGLHVNLTLGSPLGPMPRLAPSGKFPHLRDLLASSLAGLSSCDEVAGEVSRQIARFEEVVGHVPDFIDGHRHVHVLPGIRAGFLEAMQDRFPTGRPLLRDPGDSLTSIIRRRSTVAKALGLAALAFGFGASARRAGFPTNHGFAGVSAFDSSSSYAAELEASLTHPGRRHLVMCHPGYPDAELRPLDAVVERRRDELDVIRTSPGLPDVIWHLGRRDAHGLPEWPGPEIP